MLNYLKNKMKEFEAIIKSVDEEEKSIVVDTQDGKEVKLFIKDITNAYTTYDFNAALKGNTDNVNLNKLNKFNKNN